MQDVIILSLLKVWMLGSGSSQRLKAVCHHKETAEARETWLSQCYSTQQNIAAVLCHTQIAVKHVQTIVTEESSADLQCHHK